MVDDRSRVGVLFGGTSSEHDVSVNSGLNVVGALEARDHRVEPIYLDPAGRWYFGFRPDPPSLERDVEDAGEVRSLADDRKPDSGVLERLSGGALDVLFVALHGPGGEDGTIQGLLRFCGLPFTGSDVLASALAMDKERTKRLLSARGVPCPSSVGLDERPESSELARLVEEIGLPSVVKPVAGGSSFGTRVARDVRELEEAIEGAFALAPRILVESFVAGTEVTCGVLGGGREQSTALPLTEIVPVASGFFDFRAKYTVGACDEITPARVSERVAAEVRRLSVLAHESLGCEGMSRSDFIVDDEGPRYLETNTIPGLTRTSLLPQGAAAAGIEFDELVERIVRSALLRAGS